MSKLKSLFLLFFFLLFISTKSSALTVTIDPRIELCSLVAYLSGAKEYSLCRVQEYKKEVDSEFRKFENHPLISYLQKLRKENGISYDAVMNAAILMRSIGQIEPIVEEKNLASELDKRWNNETLIKFYGLLEDFKAKSKFTVFFDRKKAFYEEVKASIQSFVASATGGQVSRKNRAL